MRNLLNDNNNIYIFNIIYIMRTNVRSDEIRGFVGIVVLIAMAFKSAFSCADTMNVSL